MIKTYHRFYNSFTFNNEFNHYYVILVYLINETQLQIKILTFNDFMKKMNI